MRYSSLTRATPPVVEPVSVADAKAHLRVDGDEDNLYIASLISAAREWVEAYTDRTLIHTQWTMRMEEFPESDEEIELPRPPVATAAGVDAVSVTYTTTAGEPATLSSQTYTVDRHSTPGEIYPVYGQFWPAHRDDENSITVTWWAGYGEDGTSVPAAIRHAILLLVGYWYENRSAVLVGSISKPMEFAVESLLSSQKWGGYT